MRQAIVVSRVLASIALVLSACTSATPTASAGPSSTEANSTSAVSSATLRVMVGNLGGERFDPILQSAGAGHYNYTTLLHATLLDVDDQGKLIPGIATKWDLSTDGLSWTFTIRRGAKFHDASEVTADDVLWSLQHALGPGADKYNKVGTLNTYVKEITRIEKSGSDAVSISFKTAHLEIPQLLSPMGAGLVAILPKRPEQHNEKAELDYDRNPIGAGPMKFVEHVQAQGMKLERYDDFYQQPKYGYAVDRTVKFRGIEFSIVPEEAARIAALRGGQVDLAPIGLESKSQVVAAGGHLVFASYGDTIEPRMYQCYKPEVRCHDKRVRQALDYAINKKQIQDFYGGPDVLAVKGWYRVTPVSEGYAPALDPRPFDPDKARQLLAEAGYPGGKGFGKLILNTFPSAVIPLQVETAQIVADGWRKELGLDVEVKLWEQPAIRQAEKEQRLGDQMTWQDNDPLYDVSTSILAKYSTDNPERFAADPALIKAAQDTFAILDPAKRLEETQKLYVRLRDESYNLGIGIVNTPWAVGPRIASWQPQPLSTYASALYSLRFR